MMAGSFKVLFREEKKNISQRLKCKYVYNGESTLYLLVTDIPFLMAKILPPHNHFFFHREAFSFTEIDGKRFFVDYFLYGLA